MGLPFPSVGGLPDPEIEPRSPSFQGDSLPSKPLGNQLCNGNYVPKSRSQLKQVSEVLVIDSKEVSDFSTDFRMT